MTSTHDDAIYKALASPLRRSILYWLKDVPANFPCADVAPGRGVPATAIHRRAGLSQSALSAHLAILLRARLVTAHKAGTWVLFRRNEAAIAAFLGDLRCRL